jgi:hypothetical protein
MKVIFAVVFLSSLAPLAALHAAESKPNVLFIAVDDPDDYGSGRGLFPPSLAPSAGRVARSLWSRLP